MKKIVLLFLTCFVCGLVTQAQKLNTNQQRLKTEIYSYLRNEVSDLVNYSNTELKFTYKDIQYFVTISSEDEGPMYVTLTAGFSLNNNYDKDIVAKAGIGLNYYKGVKFYSDENSFKLQAEIFLNDTRPFIAAFHKLVDIIYQVSLSFEEEYNKIQANLPQTTSHIATNASNKYEYVWPYTQTSGDSKLFVTKVTLGKINTIVEFVSYNGGKYQYCSIDKNSYLLVNGKRYGLTRAEGIAYAPQHTDYPNYQSLGDVSLSFKLFFQPLPEGVSSFGFYESTAGGWRIESVSLENVNSIVNVNNSIIETDSHIWELVSVQCLSNQTIIHKKVTPKVSGTYMHSSQEEYIEDADTGRKYFLRNSDLGFEGNKKVVNNKNPIDFYEVYPALPSTVKRINISSGSKYYVKNLQIR